MRHHRVNRVFAAVGLLACAFGALADGTDLVVADPYSCKKWGTIGGVSAYSFSHLYCNLGDEPALVFQAGAVHPVVTTNVYRIKGGVLEQIGQGHAFHEYCVLQSAACGVCTPVDTACTALGPGCSTTTGSSTAGAQQRLASRRYINPATGELTWPIPGFGDVGDLIYKRVQVANVDLDPAANIGAAYFVESHVIGTDDGFFANSLNNAACRPILVGGMFEGGPILTPSGAASSQTAAIEMWAALDAEVHVSSVALADAREKFLLGSKAVPNGDGTWTYIYSLQNYSSVQGGGAFRVPLGGYSAVSPAFSDVAYHSGDPFDGTDWGATVGGSNFIEWAVSESWQENPDANALRWGTAYTFRFVAGSPPREGQVVVGLFGPGAESQVTMEARVPSCYGDANADGAIDFNDVTWVLSSWGTGGPLGDADHDGDVDFGDVSAILARFGAEC